MDRYALPTRINRVATAEFTYVELTSAIARRGAGNLLTYVETQRAYTKLDADWRWRFHKIQVLSETIDVAAQFARRHRLRGYDAIHLAAAILLARDRALRGLSSITFISADNEQLRAAEAEGLVTDNPDLHP